MRNDGLPERLKRVESDIMQMKMTQPLAGDAWRVYRGRTADEWDIAYEAGSTTSSDYRQIYKVRFNPADNNNALAFAYITYDVKERDTGLTFTSQVAYDDPCAIYVLVLAGFGWTTNSTLHMKFTAFSPYRGALSVETI